nr:MAG: hypothetical protein [Microvirus sp.]
MKKTAFKKTTFNSSINYDHTKQYKTVLSGTELTVPDMSLTPQEMLKRFSSGRPINVKVYDEYTGDDDVQTGVDIRTMDMAEIHEMMGTLQANITKLKTESEQRRKKQLEEDLEKSIIKKYEQRRAQEQNNQNPDKPVYIQPDMFPKKE